MGHEQGRPLDPATRYVRMFNAFFSRGGMTATYKPVFLKCLLDLGKYDIRGHNGGLPGSEWVEVDDDTVLLDLNFVAARLVKHYWDMDHGFRFRQTSNPGDAKIVQIVRECGRVGGSAKPPTLSELASGHKRARQEAIALVIKKQVLTYLLTDMPSLYVRLRGSDKIRLSADIIPFFRRHRETILHGINSKLAAHLEKLNSPALHSAAELVEDARAPRGPYPGARQFLDAEQRQRCFYCDRPHGRGQASSIDHVIPANHAFFTGMHNCVAACVTCSLKKRRRPPAAALFLGVLDRNDGLEDRLAGLPDAARRSLVGYDSVWYRKTYTASLVEHRGDARFFRP